MPSRTNQVTKPSRTLPQQLELASRRCRARNRWHFLLLLPSMISQEDRALRWSPAWTNARTPKEAPPAVVVDRRRDAVTAMLCLARERANFPIQPSGDPRDNAWIRFAFSLTPGLRLGLECPGSNLACLVCVLCGERIFFWLVI